jgi:hypothetical protein
MWIITEWFLTKLLIWWRIQCGHHHGKFKIRSSEKLIKKKSFKCIEHSMAVLTGLQLHCKAVVCHGSHNGRRASSLGGKDYFKTLNLRQHKHHNLVQCQCLSDSTEISLSSMTWYSYSLHFRKVQWGQKLAMKIVFIWWIK